MTQWKEKVRLGDVFHNDDLTLEQKAAKVAERLTPVVRRVDGPDESETDLLLEELVDAGKEDNVHWFDQVWCAIYDWADAERVWIDTLR